MALIRATHSFHFLITTALLTVLLCASDLQAAAEQAVDARIIIDLSNKQNSTLRNTVISTFLAELPSGSKAGVWTYGKFVNMLVPLGTVDARWRQLAESRLNTSTQQAQWRNTYDAVDIATADWYAAGADPHYQPLLYLYTEGKLHIATSEARNARERRAFMNRLLPRLQSRAVKVVAAVAGKEHDKNLLTALTAIHAEGVLQTVATASEVQQSIQLALSPRSAVQPVLTQPAAAQSEVTKPITSKQPPAEPGLPVHNSEQTAAAVWLQAGDLPAQLYSGERLSLPVQLQGDRRKVKNLAWVRARPIIGRHTVANELLNEMLLSTHTLKIDDYLLAPPLPLGTHTLQFFAEGDSSVAAHSLEFQVKADPLSITIHKPDADHRYFQLLLDSDEQEIQGDSLQLDTLVFDSAEDEFFEMNFQEVAGQLRLQIPYNRLQGDYTVNIKAAFKTTAGRQVTVILPDIVLPFLPLAVEGSETAKLKENVAVASEPEIATLKPAQPLSITAAPLSVEATHSHAAATEEASAVANNTGAQQQVAYDEADAAALVEQASAVPQETARQHNAAATAQAAKNNANIDAPTETGADDGNLFADFQLQAEQPAANNAAQTEAVSAGGIDFAELFANEFQEEPATAAEPQTTAATQTASNSKQQSEASSQQQASPQQQAKKTEEQDTGQGLLGGLAASNAMQTEGTGSMVPESLTGVSSQAEIDYGQIITWSLLAAVFLVINGLGVWLGRRFYKQWQRANSRKLADIQGEMAT